MAGDWIKVEHSTVDKPEVLMMAELLGLKRREMLGVLLDFWVWLDRNSRHGVVTHMSRMCLDEVTQVAGFSAVLRQVGWAEINDQTGEMTIKNWDRHNGNTAKTRALARDRKVTQRSRSESDEIVTREEKRREVKRINKKSTLPAGFAVSDRVKAWAAEKGYGRLPERLEHFIGAAKAGGYQYVDWDEAFMNAVRNDWAKLGNVVVGLPKRVAL